ncbi:binding-protein-dependent transport systems inner membrane component [Alkaliphilus metalliredigens QYMF]|uniref:Binding-protein-dependent transport systems inner membrane component n=1 Tax=Alkaliphilus metalliredigens (strain QYMF) TaxID=293826 RepID=A6TS96_ALKMQ|nr:ABC transporter permease [Alkaliphilus metalliredigens]ABR49064.1 binding-protein-dependent transport systems inner membrane component [Alkaliphilus metalliredigens QYMF]
MGKYILRRLFQQIPILIGVSILLFAIFQLAPGSPLASFYMDPSMTSEQMEQLEEAYGLNRPVHLQYVDYMRGVVVGNLGTSFQLRQPVSTLIGERMWTTFYISFVSLFISLMIAIPIGVISATKQYSIFDYAGTIFALMGVSIPIFFFALLLIKQFGIDLRWFPISGMRTPAADFSFPHNMFDLLKHSVLPLTVLGLTQAGRFMRYTRSSMLEVIRQDYIRTARAKGLNEKVVIYKHALRNALIPVVTLLGASLPILFSGALLIEIVFVWPGMGRLQYNSVLHRDYPLMMGINLFLGVLTLMGNLVADISYAFIDPRIRYD